MNAQPYEWTKIFFREIIVPEHIKRLNEKGELLGIDNKTPLPQGSEIPNYPTDVGIVIFDGDAALRYAADILTHDTELTSYGLISSSDQWNRFLDGEHAPDTTYLYKTNTGELKFSGGMLKNCPKFREPINQLLARGLPQNYSVKGGKILAAIVTTSSFPDLGAVVNKTSLDGISGSASYVRGGELRGRISAQYNPKTNSIEIVDRTYVYKQGAKHMDLDKEEVTTFAPFPLKLERIVRGKNYGPREVNPVRRVPQYGARI